MTEPGPAVESSQPPIARALLSVSDKTGLEDFAGGLGGKVVE